MVTVDHFRLIRFSLALARGVISSTVRDMKIGRSFTVYGHKEVMAAYQAARNHGFIIRSQKAKNPKSVMCGGSNRVHASGNISVTKNKMKTTLVILSILATQGMAATIAN